MLLQLTRTGHVLCTNQWSRISFDSVNLLTTFKICLLSHALLTHAANAWTYRCTRSSKVLCCSAWRISGRAFACRAAQVLQVKSIVLKATPDSELTHLFELVHQLCSMCTSSVHHLEHFQPLHAMFLLCRTIRSTALILSPKTQHRCTGRTPCCNAHAACCCCNHCRQTQ